MNTTIPTRTAAKPSEAAEFVRDRPTALDGQLPVNTNGGGLSYKHSGIYGMYGIWQLRGVASAQDPDAVISDIQSVGGRFSAAGTMIFWD